MHILRVRPCTHCVPILASLFSNAREKEGEQSELEVRGVGAGRKAK